MWWQPGRKPTSGYEIEMDKITLEEADDISTLIVYVKFRDPQLGNGADTGFDLSPCGCGNGAYRTSGSDTAEGSVHRVRTVGRPITPPLGADPMCLK